jgi:hypothetical protein
MISKYCLECKRPFMALNTEVKRGGGKYCSRTCYFLYQPKMLEEKWNGKRGYFGLHKWIQRKKGKPSLCEFCQKSEGKFEWSNISGKYYEDVSDWQRLCIKCHRTYDKTGTKAWITRRANAV